MALQAQLAQLRQNQRVEVVQKVVQPSILYTQEHASSLDNDSLYFLGLRGIRKMAQIDQQFIPIENSLFHSSKKQIARGLLNRKQNADLDAELRVCLLLLSQYFHYEGCHQAMEYLIRNFSLHLYLPDELIVYFLQYHHSAIYTRMLQNIVDHQRNTIWAFLYDPISRGQQLARSHLVRQIQLDYRILKKLIDYIILTLQPQERPQDIVMAVVDDFTLTQKEINQIKLRQPNALSFFFAVLYELNVTPNYLEQIRAPLLKICSTCLDCGTQESVALVYLLLSQQLFDSTKFWLSDQQIATLASQAYKNPQKHFDLVVLLYQFGIQTSESMSIQLLKQDLSRFYENGLLLIEIVKPLASLIPDQPLNELASYLKYQLKLNNPAFLDAIVAIIPKQMVDVLRPYLRNTDYQNLFPKAPIVILTIENVEKVIREKDKLVQISIGNLNSLMDDCVKFFLSTKSPRFVELLDVLVGIAEVQFPQANLLKNSQIYGLLEEANLPCHGVMKYQKKVCSSKELNTCWLVLYYSVNHTLSQVNQLLKIFDFTKQVKDKPELYELLRSNYQSEYQEFLKSDGLTKLHQQAKIEVALHQRSGDIMQLLNRYNQDDAFLSQILKQVDVKTLLNLRNNRSIKALKEMKIDPFLFFSDELSEFAKLKVLLHDSSNHPEFLLSLFVCSNTLTKPQKDLFVELLWKNKQLFEKELVLRSMTISKIQLKETIGFFIKNRQDKTQHSSLSQIRNTQQLTELLWNYLQKESRQRCKELASIVSTLRQLKTPQHTLIQSIIELIEKDFKKDYLQSYLDLLSLQESPDYSFLQKQLFQLPPESAVVINQYLANEKLSSKVRTQLILFVYSQRINGKQIVVDEGLDFQMIVGLFATPNQEIVAHLVELLIANVEFVTQDTAVSIFKINCRFTHLINRFLYDYVEYHQCNLLEGAKAQLANLFSSDLNLDDPLVHLNASAIVRLIAKHTQFNLKLKAFRSIAYPTAADPYNKILFLKIVVEQFKIHNNGFFNQSLYAYFTSMVVDFTKDCVLNNTLLQYFSIFESDQWWILCVIITTVQLSDDYKQILLEFMSKQAPEMKLNWISSLSESVFYRLSKSQQIFKIKVNQKLKSFRTPNLEAHLKKCYKVLKPMKAKVCLYNQLKLLSQFANDIERYLLSRDLSADQLEQVKSTILHLQKFSNCFPKSKLKKLAETIKHKVINSIKLESLIPLITNCIQSQSVAQTLLQSLSELLHSNVVSIKRSHFHMIGQLINKMLEQNQLSFEMLVCVNYFYSQPQFVRSMRDANQGLVKALASHLETLDPQRQCLVINLFSLISRNSAQEYLEYLSQIQTMLIQLLASQFDEQLCSVLRTTTMEQAKSKINKQLLVEAQINIVSGFRDLISKAHIQQIILLALQDPSQECLDALLQSLESRITYDLLGSVAQAVVQTSSKAVAHYIVFLGRLIQQSDFAQVSMYYLGLGKELMGLFDYSREQYIDSEAQQGIFLADQIEDKVCDTFIVLVTKINDVQLKKLYSQLIGWSKAAVSSGYNYRKYRKIQFFKLTTRLSDKLQQYFTKYFTYSFDAIINELQTFHAQFYETPKQTALAKRGHEEPDMHYRLELLLCRHILQAIASMCQFDEDQFLDSEKFEKLCRPLAESLDCAKVNQYEPVLAFIDEWISPSILAVFQVVNDDYKWKDLHSKMLEVVGRHSQKKNEVSGLIAVGVVKLLQKLIDQLDDRYLVLLNDLIPCLHQLTATTLSNDELEKRVKQMILRLSQLSGEDVLGALK